MPQAWQSRKHPVCGPEDLQVAWQERVAPLSAAPPYTKTPLFIELASVKQQLAALADENVRLSGFSRELTETCNHLSREVRRVKSAFGALSDLVDVESGHMRTEASRVWQESQRLGQQLTEQAHSVHDNRQGLAREREAHAEAAKRADEWMRHLVGEVEDLRDEMASGARERCAEARGSSAELAELRATVAEQASATAALAQRVGSGEEAIRRQEVLLHQACAAQTALRSDLEEGLKALRDEAREAGAGRARDVEARADALERQFNSRLEAVQAAVERAERRAREHTEAWDSSCEAQQKVLAPSSLRCRCCPRAHPSPSAVRPGI